MRVLLALSRDNRISTQSPAPTPGSIGDAIADWDRAAEQLRRRIAIDRGGEPEALRGVTTHLAQQRQLRLVLDALGDDVDTERPSHGDDDAHELGGSRIDVELTGERAIDLQPVDREAVQCVQ